MMEASWQKAMTVESGEETKASILGEKWIIFQVCVLRAYHIPWHLVEIPKASVEMKCI